MRRVLLMALDSVGIDPLGHDRLDSVYADSRFLFPRGRMPQPTAIVDGPVGGALVETAVARDDAGGAIECAITYTSIFSGQSALDRHGLMHGLGMNERLLKTMVDENNLFCRFAEQVAFSHGHPKSLVPTWYFGPDAAAQASRMRRPEQIFHVIAEHAGVSGLARCRAGA